MNEPTYVLSNSSQSPQSFVMSIQDKKMMVMDKDGIHFERANFPEWTPDDFANAFMNIFEENFCIKFEKREKNE